MWKVEYRCKECHNKMERRMPNTVRNHFQYKEGQFIFCRECDKLQPVVLIKETNLDEEEEKSEEASLILERNNKVFS